MDLPRRDGQVEILDSSELVRSQMQFWILSGDSVASFRGDVGVADVDRSQRLYICEGSDTVVADCATDNAESLQAWTLGKYYYGVIGNVAVGQIDRFKSRQLREMFDACIARQCLLDFENFQRCQ